MKGMKCVCGERAGYTPNLKFNNFDIDGWKCNSCGEVYYNPEKTEKFLLLNKLRRRNFIICE